MFCYGISVVQSNYDYGSVAQWFGRRSLAGRLFLPCTRSVTFWVNWLLWVTELANSAFHSSGVGK